MSPKHPSYYFALRQLKNGEYLSVHQCFQDWKIQEGIWIDDEYCKENIKQAYELFNRK